MSRSRRHVLPILGVPLALALTTGSAPAETLDSTVVDTRTILAFDAPDAAAREWLPGPWRPVAMQEGPFAGANLLLAFIDRLLHQAPDGAAKAEGAFRVVALVVPARHPDTGDRASFVIRVYSPHGAPGPYKNSVEASVRPDGSFRRADVGGGTGTDAWTVRPAEGGAIDFEVDYRRAVPQRVEKEARRRSAADPDFYRIYRYEQVIDIVRSVPRNVDRVSSLELDVTIPELDPLFDGSERLVGIAVVPWYTRQTYLP